MCPQPWAWKVAGAHWGGCSVGVESVIETRERGAPLEWGKVSCQHESVCDHRVSQQHSEGAWARAQARALVVAAGV